MMSITTHTKDFAAILRHVAGQDFPGLTIGASSVCSVQQVRISRRTEDCTRKYRFNTCYYWLYGLLVSLTSV